MCVADRGDLSCFKFISKMDQFVNIEETSKPDTGKHGQNATVSEVLTIFNCGTTQT